MNRCVLKQILASRTALQIKHRNYAITKQLPQLSTVKHNKQQNVEPGWTRFYRFPYIVHARVLNRLKLYQTGITILAVPVSTYFYLDNAITLNECQYVIGLASVACAMLYIVGSMFSKLIGIISMNEQKDQINVSRLTFFGNRADITMPIEDVIPFSDMDFNEKDFAYKLKRYSTEEELFIILRYGGIYDKELFQKVFGQLPKMM